MPDGHTRGEYDKRPDKNEPKRQQLDDILFGAVCDGEFAAAAGISGNRHERTVKQKNIHIPITKSAESVFRDKRVPDPAAVNVLRNIVQRCPPGHRRNADDIAQKVLRDSEVPHAGHNRRVSHGPVPRVHGRFVPRSLQFH